MWREDVPAPTDRLQDLGGQVRSLKTAIRVGIEIHSFWTDSSGLSAGIPRLDLNQRGPGSARAFYGTASQVSAYRDGALMLSSDGKRMYGLTSVSSALLGGVGMAVYSSGATIATDSRVLPQFGQATGLSQGTTAVTFGTAYSDVPISVSLSGQLPAVTAGYTYALRNSFTTGFLVRVDYAGTGADPGTGSFQYFSLGTVAL